MANWDKNVCVENDFVIIYFFFELKGSYELKIYILQAGKDWIYY